MNRLTVWGNHSKLVFPDFANAFIDDQPAPRVITDRAWVREVFEPTVASRSEQVMKLRGATPAATAAQAILGTVRSITTPTPFERRFGASVVSDGSYGVPRGLIFGFPIRTEEGSPGRSSRDSTSTTTPRTGFLKTSSNWNRRPPSPTNCCGRSAEPRPRCPARGVCRIARSRTLRARTGVRRRGCPECHALAGLPCGDSHFPG